MLMKLALNNDVFSKHLLFQQRIDILDIFQRVVDEELQLRNRLDLIRSEERRVGKEV